MNEGRMRTVAIIAAVAVHIGAVGAVWGVNTWGGMPGDHGRKLEAIEAGLAVRKKDSRGKKKSRLPQKVVDRKAKAPEGPTITRDDEAAPAKPEKDEPEPPPPDLADPSSVFDKYRNMDTPGEETPIGEGDADDSTEGVDEGSDYGTLDDARGDPYVGELVGRLNTNPDPMIPGFVPHDGSLRTQICVRLDADGGIASLDMPDETKSKNPTYNSAVLKRAKETKAMPSPVPEQLRPLLVERGICIAYTY